jgi:DNA helicase HerA-like ATPase
LAPVLAFFAVIILIGLSNPGAVFITVNPYLRSKYDVYVLKNNDRTLYIIIEKEKEYERPKFSEYIIDWFYGHEVLIGFRKRE